MLRKLLSIYLTIMLCLLLVPLTSHAAEKSSFTLSISNDKPEVGKDKEVKVTVKGNNLQDVYAYEVNFEYDPSQLRLKEAKSTLTGFAIPVIVKNNQIQFASTKIGKVAGESGNVPLCTLTFEPIGQGKALVKLTDVKLVSSKLVSNKQNANTQITMNIQSGNKAMFRDIAGHWAKDAIERAAKQGFVNGYEDGTFRPQGLVTRAEFAKMLALAMQLPLSYDVQLTFTDVDRVPEWAKPSVSAATTAGIVSGYEDNTFRSNNLISRAEMTAMIVRALGIKVEAVQTTTFADDAQIAAWARPYVSAATEAELIKGQGNNLFAPNAKATRAEAVTLILSMLDHK